MNKFGLIVLFCVSSLAFAGGKKAPAPVPSTAPTSIHVVIDPKDVDLPPIAASPTPEATKKPYITFTPVLYYTTPAERVKIKAAEKVLNDVVQSPCFKGFMSKRKLIQTNARTPYQVALRLQAMSGEVPVEMYYRSMSGIFGTSAVAYRNVGDNTVHLNRAWFQTTDSDEEWAATLAHEGLGHVLGEYTHDFKWSPSRSFSIPYSLGGGDKAQGGDVFDACAE